MKTKNIARSLRTLHALLPALLGAIIVLFFAFEARGQMKSAAIVQPPNQVFSWGSSDAVYQFAATNSQYVTVIVAGKASATSSYVELASINSPEEVFTDKSQLNALFQQYLLATAQFALTNATIAYDKSLPLQVGAYTTAYDFDSGWEYYYLTVTTNFSLVNVGGNYSLPDLSGIRLAPYNLLPVHVLGLDWARLEVYYTTNTTSPFYVADSRYDPPTLWYAQGIDIVHEEIYIPTSYLQSGSTGPVQLKISMVSSANDDAFQVFNGSGYLIRTPLVLSSPHRDGDSLVSTANGGDPGETFVVQSSTNLTSPKNWTFTSSEQFVVSTNGVPVLIQESSSAIGNAFFRLCTTNVVPQ